MKPFILPILCFSIAACSATAGGPGNTVSTVGEKTANACDDAVEAQTNAAMLGGALGIVGSLGGLGGRGGMIAGQVASTAGNMVATSQAAEARAEVMQECYGSANEE